MVKPMPSTAMTIHRRRHALRTWAGLLMLLLLPSLFGCPVAKDGPATADGSSHAESTNPQGASADNPKENEQASADSGAEPTNSDDEPTDIVAPEPLSDEAREKFIANMREIGVSVELDDEKHIKSLVMGFTKTDDESLAKLPALPRLEFIGVDHTNITDKGVQTLSKRKSLKAVYLGGNDISAAGLKHLAGLTNLEYLDLSDLEVGDEALEPLSNLKSLTKLNLTSTNVSLEGTIDFAKNLPDLEVSAPFGHLVGGARLTMDAGVEDDDLAKLKSLESLRELNLWECDNITDAGLAHVIELTQLTTLELGYTKVTDAGLAKLESLVNLKQLDVRETETSIGAALKLANVLPELHIVADWGTVDGAAIVHFEPQTTDDDLIQLKHAPALTSLNLWRCDQLTDAAMQHVAQCKALRELNLGATNIGDEGVTKLKDLSQLSRLVLANTKLTDAGVKHVGGLASLQDLDLSSTGVTDAGLAELANLESLASLNVGTTSISDPGVAELASLKSLEELSLEQTAINGECLKTLAMDLPKLQRLDLSLTLLTDDALASIPQFDSLTEIGLSGTQITDEGVKHLHQPTLKMINLFGTSVSNEAVEELRKSADSVEVIHGFDTVEQTQ